LPGGGDVFCRIARGEERGFVAYSDGEVIVLIDVYPAVRGQAVVVPREHFTFFYQMPDRLVAHFYAVVNAVGRAMARLYRPKAVVVLARVL
jgi:histidine triad (HIT) family protein